MKIVYCIPALYTPSGMERVLSLKANYFADILGYDIYIITTDGGDKKPYFPLSPRIKLINLNINFDELYGKSLYKRVGGYLKKQLVFRRKLSKTLFRLKPNITISTLRREINFINSIKDGSVKIGEIHFSRANYRDLNQEKLPVFLQRMLGRIWMKQLVSKLKRLDAFVVLTHEDSALWPELKNCNVIPNPLSFYPKSYSNCSSKKVIAVGRYTYQKGFDLLLNTWVLIKRKHPDWTLTIYGEGDKIPFIEQAAQLQISDVCFLHAAVSDIQEKYCESSIFVLSSRYEGFGMVIAEAMACGIPAVSFACPCGPKDIIRDNEDGLLVENGNIEELAEKICYLIENEKERKEMGQKARINIERYKMDVVAKEWENLFNKCCKMNKKDENKKSF